LAGCSGNDLDMHPITQHARSLGVQPGAFFMGARFTSFPMVCTVAKFYGKITPPLAPANLLSREQSQVTAFQSLTTCWSHNFKTALGELVALRVCVRFPWASSRSRLFSLIGKWDKSIKQPTRSTNRTRRTGRMTCQALRPSLRSKKVGNTTLKCRLNSG